MVPKSNPVSYSPTWTFFEGEWREGNVPIMGSRTHGLWLGSTGFDGARAFEGVTPDLDRHVWTAPSRQGPFCVSANGSGSGHVYGLEKRSMTAGPDGDRGPNSNHCGAL